MTRCPHITVARVCCDPARPYDPGVTWCSDRAGWRAYMDGVDGSEGRGSMEMLRAAFIASRAAK